MRLRYRGRRDESHREPNRCDRLFWKHARQRSTKETWNRYTTTATRGIAFVIRIVSHGSWRFSPGLRTQQQTFELFEIIEQYAQYFGQLLKLPARI